MLSENGDAEKASKETSYFTPETVNAQSLEKRWFKLVTQSYHICSCGTHIKRTTACLNTLSKMWQYLINNISVMSVHILIMTELDELQMQIEDKKGQQLDNKERAEKHAVKVT